MTPQDFWPPDHETPAWLPDWRYEDEYPSSDHATKQDFAWEFLRRNLLYQRDYQRISELYTSEGVHQQYKQPLGFSIFPSLMEKQLQPESIKFHAELYQVLTKWGLSYYLIDPAFESYSFSHPETKVYEYCPQEESDPKVTPRNRYVSLDINQLNSNQQRRYRLAQGIDGKGGVDLRMVGRVGSFNCAVDVINHNDQYVPVDGGIVPTNKEIPYLFDLSLPIEPQILNAKAQLEASQVRMIGKKIEKSKTSIKDYPLYLRVLDADARGVSNNEIKSVIPSINFFVVRRGAYSLIDKNYRLLL